MRGMLAVTGMVGEVGLEPTKHYAADLQSAPFAARDIPPKPVKCERVMPIGPLAVNTE